MGIKETKEKRKENLTLSSYFIKDIISQQQVVYIYLPLRIYLVLAFLSKIVQVCSNSKYIKFSSILCVKRLNRKPKDRGSSSTQDSNLSKSKQNSITFNFEDFPSFKFNLSKIVAFYLHASNQASAPFNPINFFAQS